MREKAVKPTSSRPAIQAVAGAKAAPAKESDASRPSPNRASGFALSSIPYHPPAQRVEASARSVEAPPKRAPDRPDGLPSGLRRGVESLSGIPVHDVRVRRNSPEPAKIGALAYARGTEIHLGPGQERHLPHEAWHVVQQRQGRVKATIQAKGVPVNDDPALEREADVMGRGALRSRPFQNDIPPASASSARGSSGGVAQRKQFEDKEEYGSHVARFDASKKEIEGGQNELNKELGSYIATIKNYKPDYHSKFRDDSAAGLENWTGHYMMGLHGSLAEIERLNELWTPEVKKEAQADKKGGKEKPGKKAEVPVKSGDADKPEYSSALKLTDEQWEKRKYGRRDSKARFGKDETEEPDLIAKKWGTSKKGKKIVVHRAEEIKAVVSSDQQRVGAQMNAAFEQLDKKRAKDLVDRDKGYSKSGGSTNEYGAVIKIVNPKNPYPYNPRTEKPLNPGDPDGTLLDSSGKPVKDKKGAPVYDSSDGSKETKQREEFPFTQNKKDIYGKSEENIIDDAIKRIERLNSERERPSYRVQIRGLNRFDENPDSSDVNKPVDVNRMEPVHFIASKESKIMRDKQAEQADKNTRARRAQTHKEIVPPPNDNTKLKVEKKSRKSEAFLHDDQDIN